MINFWGLPLPSGYEPGNQLPFYYAFYEISKLHYVIQYHKHVQSVINLLFCLAIKYSQFLIKFQYWRYKLSIKSKSNLCYTRSIPFWVSKLNTCFNVPKIAVNYFRQSIVQIILHHHLIKTTNLHWFRLFPLFFRTR